MCVKCHSFQVTTVLHFTLVHCPACWPCQWVVPPLSSIPSNNHKYVRVTLPFHLGPASKHGKQVCEVCIKWNHSWIPACWPCLWVVPPLASTPSNNHKYVCSILLFTLSLSPSMVSQSVRHAYCFKLKSYPSLLLYIVLESQHVHLDCELCLHYHPCLTTSIKLRTQFYFFTLTLNSRMLSQSEVYLKWHSLHVKTVLQFALLYCPESQYVDPVCATVNLPSIPNNKYKIVCSILLFYFVPKSKHVELVCQACLYQHSFLTIL